MCSFRVSSPSLDLSAPLSCHDGVHRVNRSILNDLRSGRPQRLSTPSLASMSRRGLFTEGPLARNESPEGVQP